MRTYVRYLLQGHRQNSPTPYYLLAGVIFMAIVVVGGLTFRQLQDNDQYANPLLGMQTAIGRSSADLLGAEKVKDLAMAKAPDASVADVKLQNDSGQLVYVVNFTSGEKLTFDAQTGTSLPNAPAVNNQPAAKLPEETNPKDVGSVPTGAESKPNDSTNETTTPDTTNGNTSSPQTKPEPSETPLSSP